MGFKYLLLHGAAVFVSFYLCAKIGLPDEKIPVLYLFMGVPIALFQLHALVAGRAAEAKEEEDRDVALRIARLNAGLPEAEEVKD